MSAVTPTASVDRAARRPADGAATPGAAAGTRLQLVRPALADVPVSGPGAPVVLDEDQARVVRAVVEGTDRALLVLGAPGTGRTTVALESVVAAVETGTDPADVLVLAATRRGAADLRDRLASRLRRTAGRSLVRTPAAVAYAVLRRRDVALGQPAPTLVSGAEQDLVLAELLAGHAAGEGVPVPWPDDVPPDVVATRAFRDELRDVLMRAAERGLDPVALDGLARRHGRPAWSAAAHLYQEYLDVLQLRGGTPDVGARFDPAVVVEEAAAALASWEDEVPGVPRPRWRLVVVDDHQESTSATARLLRVLADDGARVVLLGDPDCAVQTFRGAAPELLARAAAAGDGPGELDARTEVLGTVWRHGPGVRSVVARVAERIGTLGAVRQRAAVAAPPQPDAPPDERPTVALLPSVAQEAAFVAHALRTAAVRDGVAWADMAVIARSGAQVAALRRALAGASVPVSVLGSDAPLREEPAVRPLLDAMQVAVGSVELDVDVAARLACSPIGGLDTVGLRHARRALRAEELAGGGGRSSDALLVEALGDPRRVATLPAPTARALGRLAEVLDAGRRAAAAPGADAQSVLWALWDASGLAQPWRRAALAGGAGGERADRDLDAVLALFRAAETFVDRMPRSSPAAFVDWMQAQDLPSDSLAARAARDAVQVLTPAGAAGREWRVVVVAGVQEGTWPDLRLRDSLLGAQLLVDVVGGRASAGDDPSARAAASRAAVLSDELRSFVVACSRARQRLLVTAVADTEHEPSPLVDLVDPLAAELAPDAPDPRRRTAPAPLDLRGLVAELRAELERAAGAGERPDPAALRTLARLAHEGVEGADPGDWYGLAEPTSVMPLWGPDQRVPVSPSRLETAQRCTLRWALEAAGGTAADSGGQSLGTLVHAIAQEHPRGTAAELRAALDERWGELGLGDGWPARAVRRKADAMVDRLAAYLAGAGEPVVVEGSFRVTTERAELRGQVDRVERTADGVRVVDLKTGTTMPSTAQAQSNPQLGAYQLAVEAGAIDGVAPGEPVAGAQLVFLSSGKAGAVRRQDPLVRDEDGSTWAHRLVDDVASSMAASTFVATANELCDRCPVRRACPVRDEGGQVTA